MGTHHAVDQEVDAGVDDGAGVGDRGELPYGRDRAEPFLLLSPAAQHRLQIQEFINVNDDPTERSISCKYFLNY